MGRGVSHPAKFETDFDINDLELRGIGFDSDPLGGARVSEAPSMTHASTSHAAQPTQAFASTTTTIAVADVPEESEESKDSKPKDDFVALVMYYVVG
jgi:hypothetical protein